ncbi:hypothetical protein H5410_033480 [Solanum commersonii]|uniref:Uncharacterized protein n=1 Tax=Solanum commersonii TaxID=4109 RepID=A0A9J5YT82_SOLCO|nr:hypothetical protein H5410_033480 [Solanum commersonii]
MDIPFLLAISISSRRPDSLLHFLNCVLSCPVLLCVPVVICFMVNLHFMQATIVFSSFCTKNFHTKDPLTRTMVFEKAGKGGNSSCSGPRDIYKRSFINMSIVININSKSRWQMFRIRTTSSSPIIFSFQHWSFTTISFRIHVQV